MPYIPLKHLWRGPRLGWLMLLAIMMIAMALPVARPAFAAGLTVNSTADAADANPGDGVCATAGAVCTLRAAIEEANALTGADTINFNIPAAGVQTIAPASDLPQITEAVVIDGLT